MATHKEAESYVHIQTRGNLVDVWRIEKDMSMSHETHATDLMDAILFEREVAANGKLREANVFLGLSIATVAVMFVEAIRSRSKALTAISLLPITGALYAGIQVNRNKKEINWLEKEVFEGVKQIENF